MGLQKSAPIVEPGEVIGGCTIEKVVFYEVVRPAPTQDETSDDRKQSGSEILEDAIGGMD